MSEKLIRSFIMNIIQEAKEPVLVSLADESYRLNPDISGSNPIIVNLSSSNTRGKLAKQLDKNAEDFIRQLEKTFRTGSRVDIGDLFEDLIQQFTGGAANTNPQVGADFPFADIEMTDDDGKAYYSVKGTKKADKTKGFASSQVHVNTLLSMILKLGGDVKVGILSSVTSTGDEKKIIRIDKYGPVPARGMQTDNIGTLEIGGQTLEFTNVGSGGDPAWKLNPETKPDWLTKGGAFTTNTESLQNIFGLDGTAQPFLQFEYIPPEEDETDVPPDHRRRSGDSDSPARRRKNWRDQGAESTRDLEKGEAMRNFKRALGRANKADPSDNTAKEEFEANIDALTNALFPKLKEQQLRSLISGILLTEELTKTDKKEINKLVKKGIERDRAEQKRIIRKEIETELKSSLGKSFFGNPGKVRKAIEEIARDELSREMKAGSQMEQSVVEITKKVLGAWHEMLYKQQNIISRIKIK